MLAAQVRQQNEMSCKTNCGSWSATVQHSAYVTEGTAYNNTKQHNSLTQSNEQKKNDVLLCLLLATCHQRRGARCHHNDKLLTLSNTLPNVSLFVDCFQLTCNYIAK